MRRYIILVSMLLGIVAMATMCRKEEGFSGSEHEPIVGFENPFVEGELGMYILNNGGKGNYETTLDFLDVEGNYLRNIYGERNPLDPTLGDDGVDMLIHGEYLFIVLRGSHKVVVLDAHSTEKVGEILGVNEPSSIMVYGEFGYITCMVRPGIPEGSEPLGELVKFRIGEGFPIVARTAVGCQPTDAVMVSLGATDMYILVANSGEYMKDIPEGYKKWISVVTPSPFRQIGFLDEVPYPFAFCVEPGKRLIWVASRANGDVPSMRKYKVMNEAVALRDEKKLITNAVKVAYSDGPVGALISTLSGQANANGSVSQPLFSTFFYSLGNADRDCVGEQARADLVSAMDFSLSSDQSKAFVLDARNFASSGMLFCIDANSGNKLWSARTGIIPTKLAFLKQ